VQDRAAARGQVVYDSLRLGLRLRLELLGQKRCERAGGADPDPPVRLPVCLGRLQSAAQHLDRVALGSAFLLADRGGVGIRAPARRRRRLAIPDASAGTGLGLSRLGRLDPLREGRRGAPDLGGSGAER
jgi:hypothetical protein